MGILWKAAPGASARWITPGKPPLATCTSRSHGTLIIGTSFGVILFIVLIIVSCWMILKCKKGFTADVQEQDVQATFLLVVI
ncbi:complement component receptor 1-like protein [Phyllostomus discolor]|uniref:Complement component receptor 1-like protein n=1 Tax=Phyllostomus discolor TaxID=89673 RepID=A0A7E6CVQ6_9CHIR|nr:complement component receptor 1-like protein [Phyllostomus discolor]